MRISVFLNNDLASNIALNYLLPELTQHQFNIYLSDRVGTFSHQTRQLQYLDFLEREFILNAVFPKIENQNNNRFLTFNQIGKKFKIAITHVSDIRSQKILTQVSSFNPDLFISIRFGKIFKGSILRIPPLGIINLHSAILPDYRGVIGTFRAFMDGQSTIGTTIHYIQNDGIDNGDILAINKSKVSFGKSILWHILNLYPPAVLSLCGIIDQIANHKVVDASPQPPGGQYYSFPNETDFNMLEKKGIQLFNLEEYAAILSSFYALERKWILGELKHRGIPEKC